MKIRYPIRLENEAEIPDGDFKRYLLHLLFLDSDMMEASKPSELTRLEQELAQTHEPQLLQKCMLYARESMRYLLDFLSQTPFVKLEF
jgi:hypothetical protein